MGDSLFDLKGRSAVVTGGTRGLGRAMAEALAEHGADIALLQRAGEDTTCRRIREMGRRCEIFHCDLSDMVQVQAAAGTVLEAFGRIDILVCAAGIQERYPAAEFPEAAWDRVLDVNLKSVFLLNREFGKRMVEQGSGKIINIASLLSFQGGITVPAYAAAKGGIAQLTKALANEWAGKGVCVNAIAPGYMATDMTEALMQDDTRSRQILERIPAARWGLPEDMKGSVVFLASKASDYVHGHTLLVDGGWMGR